MRLISLQIHNYRIHGDTRVEFDEALNLIGGPNESGKSTLLEAAHRALFLNHRRGGADLESMQSRTGSGAPEVELEFEQNGVRYHLVKHFHGTKTASHAELGTDSHDRWTGNDAEHQLARLLGLDEPLAARDATRSWAHLWIRQGASGNDPTAELNSEQSTLLTRLQDEGGAAVMRSPLDSLVGTECANAYARCFTGTGQVKAGSELKNAEATLAERQRVLDERTAAATRLEAAIREHEQATKQRDEALKSLPALEASEKETQAKIAEANQLKEALTGAGRDLAEARSKLTTQADADRRIRELTEELERLEKAVEPLGKRVAEARAARTAAEAAAKEQAKTLESAVAATRSARHQRDLLQQHLEHHRAHAALSKIKDRLEKIEALGKELTTAQQALAAIPAIQESDVARLQKLSTRIDQARASLESIAAGIEWLAGDDAPTLDGTPLPLGDARIITEPCDLEVAGHRFRIRPGGGRSLEEVRETLGEAESALRQALEDLGVADPATASRHVEERRTHTTRIREIESRIEALDPDETKAEAERLQATLNTSAAEVSRLLALAGEVRLPEEAEAISEALAKAVAELTEAESAEVTGRARQQEAQDRAGQLVRDLEQVQQELTDATTHANKVRVTRETLVKEHGEKAIRRDRIAALQRSVEALETREAEITTRLKALLPEHLERDLARFQQSIRDKQELAKQAELKLATASATLASDGTRDPYAATEEARRALERAAEDHASANRRAGAVRLLHELFEEENQRLSDQLTEPLAERISAYLQCLFGTEARARVRQQEGDFQGLELIRPGGPFGFDELSGGTREQLAAAVRLAMAELLAEEHGGCLPVVFDDAFTNSDPDRIAGLQRMLDFAASRGLQLIVLTCTPADYASLGARTIPMETPTGLPAAPAAEASLDPAPSSSQATAPDTVPQADIDLLLETLPQLGGKAGNQKLRETLGWDEGRYSAAKDLLVSRGNLTPGKGRGGSVAIPDYL